MTAQTRATPKTPADGGLAARRAVVRWAWRMFRREWRQQTLVLALVAFTVAAVTLSVSATYNMTGTPPSAKFGTATQRLLLDGSDAQALQADIADIRRHLGAIDVIAHQNVPVPGSVDPLDLRSQDPQGRFGASMLRLLSGRHPGGAAEIAFTDATARTYHAHVGSTVDLGGRRVTVTGLVENPYDLSDEFALAPPGSAEPSTSVTVLAHPDAARFDAFRTARAQPLSYTERERSTKSAAAAAVFAVATVAMLLVSLVAAAGFAAVAQRRMRQIGMLAAIGATGKHLRLVLLTHGVVIGVIASVSGTVTGLLAWLVLAPRLETAAEHRIPLLSLPWPLIGLGVLVAIATPTAAAWWPARTIARIPITAALSARPPGPRATARTSVAATVVCLAAGVTCLGLAHQSSPPLIIGGTLAIVLGILFVSPLAIRVLTSVAGRVPIATRLALRDLGRYRARSGAALAAISLALGIPVAIVVNSAAAQNTAAQGNLPGTQLLVRTTAEPDRVAVHTTAEAGRIRSAVDRYAATLGHSSVVPLMAAVDPSVKPDRSSSNGQTGRPVIVLGEQTGPHSFHATSLYVATPELARHYGLDLSRANAGTDVLTGETGPREFGGGAFRDMVAQTQVVKVPAYSSAPTAMITPAGMRRGGWQAVPAGWLIDAGRPLTGAQITAARDMAAGAGLAVEARRDQSSLRTVRWGATAGGAILALGVLAMTVGTIRGEAVGELRTLTAAGATRAIRRTLTAVTAGALALGGVVLGTIGAYLGLIGAYLSRLDTLGRIPIGELTVTVVGVPLLAAAAGWLFAGREPDTIARRLLE